MATLRTNANGQTEIGCHECGSVVGTVEDDGLDISDALRRYYCSNGCKNKSLFNDILRDIGYKMFKHVVFEKERVA